MKRIGFFSIENKILIPFVCISLITVFFFCFILYRTEYHIKIESESDYAMALAGYINSDINAGDNWQNSNALLEKYEANYTGQNLFIYDSGGHLLLGQRTLSDDELFIWESQDNILGWRILYSIDRNELSNTFLEEQKYMILAAVAMLLIIVEASVLISHNISAPIRQLSETCNTLSQDYTLSGDAMSDYLKRRDELGYLATAFQTMIKSIQENTAQLVQVKTLNESIVSNLPLGIIVYDQEGSIALKNSHAESMFSRQNERDGLGRNVEQLLSDIIQRESILPPPARLTDPDGTVRDYEFGIWRLHTPAGISYGTLCTADDVTYKKHMEEKMSQDVKLAYAGKLAADVAHEIRNPLAGIRAGLQVIRKKLTEERDTLLCQGMVHEVDRVNLLIGNLLNLSRQRQSEKTTVNLNALCEELLMLYSKIAENKGIDLQMKLEGTLWLYTDEGELRQILINLINNSFHAIPNGGSVTILGRVGEDGIVIEVTDTGTGMDDLTLKQVRSGEKGGLGLAIVQQLLEQNAGGLAISSSAGLGTIVTLTFLGREETL